MQLSTKTLLILLPFFLQALAKPVPDAVEPFPVASFLPVPTHIITPREADILQDLENQTKQILSELEGKLHARAGDQVEIQALQDDIARLKALQKTEGPAAAAGEQKGIDSIQAVLDSLQGGGGKAKRAGDQAAISALQADIARLKALQAQLGPDAKAGIQKGIDSIQAELDRLQGQ